MSITERSDVKNFDINAATEFINSLDVLRIDDFNAKGFWFSWSSKSGVKKSRIDGATLNYCWLRYFHRI